MGIALALLLGLVLSLVSAALYTLWQYRSTVEEIARRTRVLPVATELNTQISDLRSIVGELQGIRQAQTRPTVFDLPSMRAVILETMFADGLVELAATQKRLDAQFDMPDEYFRQTSDEIRVGLVKLQYVHLQPDSWGKWNELVETLEDIQSRSGQLPIHLQHALDAFLRTAKQQSRWLLLIVGCAGAFSGLLLLSILHLTYVWLLRPLQAVIDGSRRIAKGDFQHRIPVRADDEMGDLAKAMNDMADRFETIRRDLDEQVKLRTQEAVRIERLASVGFLAAGVAHEINNPLASIAMCAESLQNRVPPFLASAPDHPNVEIIERYLQMIQEEAFRCKEITEKLLDFSRMEKEYRTRTNLTSLVFGMVEMIMQQPRYKGRKVNFDMPEPVFASVNPQEMKQVAINLLTNALDALPEKDTATDGTIDDGKIMVRLRASQHQVVLTMEDNGCGMSAETLRNIFEPFYTNRKGGQGNGLGLSITHRIITDHNGSITASSPGIGQGSTFVVTLPQ
jgi:signal transduction histidine kinase